jgi:hypothetical protein
LYYMTQSREAQFTFSLERDHLRNMLGAQGCTENHMLCQLSSLQTLLIGSVEQEELNEGGA